MREQNIFRPMEEKDRKFIDKNIGIKDEDDLLAENTAKTETKLLQRNRKILIESDNPLDSIKSLCDVSAYKREAKVGLLMGKSIKECFEKFTNVLELDKVTKFEHFSRKGRDTEYSVTICLKPSSLTGQSLSFSFQKQELKKEVYEMLVQESYKFDNDEKW